MDQQVIATIKGIINARAVLATNEQLMDTQTQFFASLERPEARQRIQRLFEKGLQQPGELEMELGKRI